MAIAKTTRNKPHFDERKTTQAAAVLLKCNKGRMNYTKLVKLLYNIDREAIKRWKTPVTFDDHYSMPHGLVVSNTLDKVEEQTPTNHSYWNDYIETRDFVAHLKDDSGQDALSQAEVELIVEIFEKYKFKRWRFMEAEHHNPKLFPEYVDPHGSSIRNDPLELLEKLQFSEEEIEDFDSRMKEKAILETLA